MTHNLPRDIAFMLYGTIGLFYASSVYDHRLAGILWYAKWIPLFLLMFLSLRLTKKGYARIRPGPPVWGVSFLLLLFLGLNLLVTQDIRRSATVYGSLFTVLISAQLLANMLSSLQLRRQFFDIIANVGKAVIGASFLMLLGGINLGRGVGRFSGWTDNPNTLALMVAPTLVILVAYVIERRRGWVRYDIPFVVAGFVLLAATESRASILWISVSIYALWMIRTGLGLSFYLGVAVLFLAVGWWDDIVSFAMSIGRHQSVSIETDVLSGRDEVWALAVDLIRQRPLLGYGLGLSEILIKNSGWLFREHQGGHFHNSYLTIIVEAGVVGVVVFLLVLLRALNQGFRSARYALREYRENWPTASLFWVLLLGALAHATFESWLLSAGNANTFMFWTCVWICFLSGRRSLSGSGLSL